MLKIKAQGRQAAMMVILTDDPCLTPGPLEYKNWIKKRKRICGSWTW